MAEFDEALRRNLENDWGPAAKHSDYRRGDTLRYRADGAEQSGTIIWIVAAGEEPVQGRAPVPMHYICEREGWADNSFPDVVYQGDVIQS